jgi:hypothetical protein
MLTALNRNNRGSDILGFLENDSGLGMLLLDSKIEGWIRVRGRILQCADSQGFQKAASIITSVVKPIVYPTCIADAQDLNAIEAVSQELANPVADAAPAT